MMVSIVPVTEADLPEIHSIYNHFVLTSTATFDLTERPFEERVSWFRSLPAGCVAVVMRYGIEVAGYGAVSPWGGKEGYAGCGEVSLYLIPKFQGKGFGKQLLKSLMEGARAGGLHTLIARITTENPISLHLHLKAGFKEVGTLKEAGDKFGRKLDVTFLQAMLGE
jgi:phosphinothricin acetyltransferase